MQGQQNRWAARAGAGGGEPQTAGPCHTCSPAERQTPSRQGRLQSGWAGSLDWPACHCSHQQDGGGQGVVMLSRPRGGGQACHPHQPVRRLCRGRLTGPCPQSWSSRSCVRMPPRARSWTSCGPACWSSSPSSWSASATEPPPACSRWEPGGPRPGRGGPEGGSAPGGPVLTRALPPGEVGPGRRPAGEAPGHPRLRQRHAARRLGPGTEQRGPAFHSPCRRRSACPPWEARAHRPPAGPQPTHADQHTDTQMAPAQLQGPRPHGHLPITAPTPAHSGTNPSHAAT